MSTKLTVKTGEDAGAPIYTLCKLSEEGEISQMHTTIRLRGDRNEYYPRKMKDPDNDCWVIRKVITAQGFARINNYLGVTFSSPPSVQIGEKTLGNPYMERDGASVRRVTARRIGMARSAAGSLAAVDLTVTYDLDDYLVGELWARWQPTFKRKTPAEWGRVVGDRGSIKLKETEKLIECPGGIWMVLDLTSSFVIDLWSQHLQRQKFAERNAISICERNILKRFLGFSYANEDGSVGITHWSQPDRNVKQWDEIARRIQEGMARVEGMDVQVEAASEVIEREEAEAAIYGEGEDAPTYERDEEEQEQGPSVESLTASIRKLWRTATPEVRQAALARAGMEQPKEIGSCDDVGILSNLLDALKAKA